MFYSVELLARKGEFATVWSVTPLLLSFPSRARMSHPTTVPP